jgi:hypothetical protein
MVLGNPDAQRGGQSEDGGSQLVREQVARFVESAREQADVANSRKTTEFVNGLS